MSPPFREDQVCGERRGGGDCKCKADGDDRRDTDREPNDSDHCRDAERGRQQPCSSGRALDSSRVSTGHFTRRTVPLKESRALLVTPLSPVRLKRAPQAVPSR